MLTSNFPSVMDKYNLLPRYVATCFVGTVYIRFSVLTKWVGVVYLYRAVGFVYKHIARHVL